MSSRSPDSRKNKQNGNRQMVQTDSLNNFAVVICGPTGSGKTKLAIDIANRLNGEIISADSIAVYKGLDVGAAKPDINERKQAVHHMIDVVEPTQEFSVAEYKETARKIMFSLLKEGKVPIICGGTGYYIDALLYDYSYGNCPKNEDFRKDCDEIIRKEGIGVLYERLKIVDEKTADVLHLNDKMRIVRALEIYETTGRKKSDIVDEKTPVVPFFAFSYRDERECLYERINLRVDKMFESGLVAEVQGLLNRGVKPSDQSMQGIGYKEVVEGLFNGYNEEEIKETVKRNTRRYAKRQITWFKRLDGLVYVERSTLNADKYIEDYINGKLQN